MCVLWRIVFHATHTRQMFLRSIGENFGTIDTFLLGMFGACAGSTVCHVLIKMAEIKRNRCVYVSSRLCSGVRLRLCCFATNTSVPHDSDQ
jgi:hypothetical protein